MTRSFTTVPTVSCLLSVFYDLVFFKQTHSNYNFTHLFVTMVPSNLQIRVTFAHSSGTPNGVERLECRMVPLTTTKDLRTLQHVIVTL